MCCAARFKDVHLLCQEINDLCTSPDNPRVIASASDDTTVRLWSLDAAHAKQPCICLLGGEGHSWSLLTAVCWANDHSDTPIAKNSRPFTAPAAICYRQDTTKW